MNYTTTNATPEPSGDRTRDALITAARRLFAENGFDGASVRAITRAADSNLGAVTYHFGSKRDLYAVVLAEGLRPMAAQVVRAADSEGTALDRIVRVVEVYFDYLERHPDLPGLLLQEVAAGKPPPPVVMEVIRGVMTTISSLQVAGESDGSIRPGHPVLTALSVVSQPIYMTLVAPLLKNVAGLDLREGPTRTLAVDHATSFVRTALAPHPESIE